MQMAHINSSYEKHEGSDMHPDYDISWTNSSDHSTVNGSHNNHHLHPNISYNKFCPVSISYHYIEHFYQFHDFKEKIYVCVWTFLVILTALVNVLIVAVFVQKSMRTTTNFIILLIAISNSLTGFVTLPTYMHAFTIGKLGWVSLNDGWCEAFMISKFYISKAFHTVSVWQTLLLGFHRFICVWFPFKAKSWLTTSRTLIAVAVITIFAFAFHFYHLTEKKADKLLGFCQWDNKEPCVGNCTVLLMTLHLVVILPTALLLVLTILMIQRLFHHNIQNGSFGAEQSRMRYQQNKRASIIVVCIAIIVLIPEIPYGIFLLVNVNTNYRANHIFYDIYDIALLISFNATFWVYIILNRRFRDELKSMFRQGIRKLLPKCSTTVPITTVSMDTNPRSTFV